MAFAELAGIIGVLVIFIVIIVSPVAPPRRGNVWTDSSNAGDGADYSSDCGDGGCGGD